ncbi:MAG: ATP phosphoribosyltransferase regulatory subunit [candidate division WOR-3 bacterium]
MSSGKGQICPEKAWSILTKTHSICLSAGWSPILMPPTERVQTYLELLGTIPPDLMTSSHGLALQYDPTCSVIRMLMDNALPGKRVFYFAPVSRNGRTSWQIGFEVLGEEMPYGEIEAIMMMLAVIESLGLSEYRVSLAPPGYEGRIVERTELDASWLDSLGPLISLLGEKAIIGGVFPVSMEYYRRVRFLIYTRGAGIPIGAGGRYDGAIPGLLGTGGYLDLEILGRMICLP